MAKEKTKKIAKYRVDEIQSLYEDETPRSKILIMGSALDEMLKKLLEIYLVTPRGDDDLLDQYKPLGEFKARIDLAERLGLISSALAGDLHIIRRLRNSCAHTLETFDFESGSTKDRVDILYSNLGKGIKGFFYAKGDPETCEEKFEAVTAFYMYYLEDLTDTTSALRPAHLELMLYDDHLEERKTKSKTKDKK